ncbi:hypothetical protein ACFQL4_16315 [Halosimplex aquaticum]
MTPLLDDWPLGFVGRVRRHEYPVTVLSPGATGSGSLGRRVARRERDVRLADLSAAGATVVDWGRSDSVEAALADALASLPGDHMTDVQAEGDTTAGDPAPGHATAGDAASDGFTAAPSRVSAAVVVALSVVAASALIGRLGPALAVALALAHAVAFAGSLWLVGRDRWRATATASAGLLALVVGASFAAAVGYTFLDLVAALYPVQTVDQIRPRGLRVASATVVVFGGTVAMVGALSTLVGRLTTESAWAYAKLAVKTFVVPLAVAGVLLISTLLSRLGESDEAPTPAPPGSAVGDVVDAFLAPVPGRTHLLTLPPPRDRRAGGRPCGRRAPDRGAIDARNRRSSRTNRGNDRTRRSPGRSRRRSRAAADACGTRGPAVCPARCAHTPGVRGPRRSDCQPVAPRPTRRDCTGRRRHRGARLVAQTVDSHGDGRRGRRAHAVRRRCGGRRTRGRAPRDRSLADARVRRRRAPRAVRDGLHPAVDGRRRLLRFARRRRHRHGGARRHDGGPLARTRAGDGDRSPPGVGPGPALAAAGTFVAAGFAAGSGVGAPVVLGALVASVVVWDAGEFGATLGREVGRTGASATPEIVHVAAALAVGASGALGAIAVYRVATGTVLTDVTTIPFAISAVVAALVLLVAALR